MDDWMAAKSLNLVRLRLEGENTAAKLNEKARTARERASELMEEERHLLKDALSLLRQTTTHEACSSLASDELTAFSAREVAKAQQVLDELTARLSPERRACMLQKRLWSPG
mmetsp:Transcript_28961/g.58347  ORF Transcript_28961/g.58347 Transcript_28961/m.58347 type:complete len:112 (+) Transcript_28961:366-701(+)